MEPRPPTIRPSNRPTVHAGIDAGGSHSEIVLVDAQLRVLARARGPAAPLAPDNVAAVTRVLATGVSEALAQAGRFAVHGLVVAAAGAGRAAERAALEAALRERRVADRVKVIGDGEAALHSAFPQGAGILILSGTGSIGYARDRAGTIRRVGGWGWQLGDEGGGYALGRAALSAAGKAADGRGPATLLVEMIQRATSTTDLDQLVRWAQTAPRDQVADLARVTCEAANDGDAVARELVEHAAHELAAHATALLRRIAPDIPDGFALAGGLLVAESPVRSRLAAALQRLAPQVPVSEAPIDPALGAAKLALTL